MVFIIFYHFLSFFIVFFFNHFLSFFLSFFIMCFINFINFIKVKPKSETVVVCFRFRFDQLRAAFEAELFKRCATGDTATASWCTANWENHKNHIFIPCSYHVHTMFIHSGVRSVQLTQTGTLLFTSFYKEHFKHCTKHTTSFSFGLSFVALRQVQSRWPGVV